MCLWHWIWRGLSSRGMYLVQGHGKCATGAHMSAASLSILDAIEKYLSRTEGTDCQQKRNTVKDDVVIRSEKRYNWRRMDSAHCGGKMVFCIFLQTDDQELNLIYHDRCLKIAFQFSEQVASCAVSIQQTLPVPALSTYLLLPSVSTVQSLSPKCQGTDTDHFVFSSVPSAAKMVCIVGSKQWRTTIARPNLALHITVAPVPCWSKATGDTQHYMQLQFNKGLNNMSMTVFATVYHSSIPEQDIHGYTLVEHAHHLLSYTEPFFSVSKHIFHQRPDMVHAVAGGQQYMVDS